MCHLFVPLSYLSFSFAPSVYHFVKKISRLILIIVFKIALVCNFVQFVYIYTNNIALFCIFPGTIYLLGTKRCGGTDVGILIPLTYFCIKKKNLHIIQILHSFAFYSADAFSTCAIAAFCIGIRQFLLLPNSTITSSSLMSISTP